jgi:hypothetical protein
MDDELRKKLASWKVQPEIPPDFQRDVWRRIAAREARPSQAPFQCLWAIRWLGLPQVAALAFVLAGLTGTGLGLVKSSEANAKNWKSLEAKYVQSIDPYERIRTY